MFGGFRRWTASHFLCWVRQTLSMWWTSGWAQLSKSTTVFYSSSRPPSPDAEHLYWSGSESLSVSGCMGVWVRECVFGVGVTNTYIESPHFTHGPILTMYILLMLNGLLCKGVGVCAWCAFCLQVWVTSNCKDSPTAQMAAYTYFVYMCSVMHGRGRRG
jgi:hypothetical protein